MDIDFIDEQNLLSHVQLELLEKLLNYAAEMEEIKEDSELSVSFINNAEIQEINRDYRGKDQPTDVISFAMQEQGEEEIQISGVELPDHLGDILISVEKAEQQAEEYQHSFQRELGFLAVHGFLHLLGYDHQTVEEEKEMFERQEHILEEFDLKRDQNG